MGCGIFDWITEPHDIVVREYKVSNGELVETTSHSRPNSLTNRLLLTTLNAILGGALTTFVAWIFLRLGAKRARADRARANRAEQH